MIRSARPLVLIIPTLLLAITLQAQGDFCSNLPLILKEVGFKESFQGIKGELVSEESHTFKGHRTITRIYRPTQDLIPGVPAQIVEIDYPGELDSYIYRINYSASSDRKAQEGNADYWAKSVRKCVADEKGWTFRDESRKYDSEEKIRVQTASVKMEGYLGFRVINVQVILYEEKDASRRKTGRYGVRIEVF